MPAPAAGPPSPSRLAELVGDADAFPVLRRWDYFNHAGIAPLPRAVADAVRRYADVMADDAVLGDANLFPHALGANKLLADLIGADAAEVAVVKNTGEAVSTVAFGLDFSPGDVVVTADVEYPANLYPWMELERRQGIRLVRVPERDAGDGRRAVSEDEVIAAAADPRCRLVTLSHVQWASGQRMDVAKIGRFCRERGVLFHVDAIQSLGVTPVDVAAMSIDFLSSGGHKWLLGGPGAGVLYVRRALQDRTRPLSVGWASVVNPMDWGAIDYTLQDTARRYECGTPNVVGHLALRAAVELLTSAGIDGVAAHVRSLGDRLIAGATAKGYRLVTPDERAGSVCFTTGDRRPPDVAEALRTGHRTEVAAREGRLRVSPHFYNTHEQIDRLIGHLPVVRVVGQARRHEESIARVYTG